MQKTVKTQPVESGDKGVNSVACRTAASDKMLCIVYGWPSPIDLGFHLPRKNQYADAHSKTIF